jgi:hypothetical protein
MLTIKAPIETALRNDLTASGDAFCEKIRGNYLQLGSYVDEADLMHLVTQPPEIFLMNGGMTSVTENVGVENTQIRKVEIINNLVNRILVSADAELSYQDRVYITNILHQLGIRDERQFMHQVYRLTKQTKEQEETINLYWNNLEEIRSMVETYADNTSMTFRTDEEVFHQEVLHLHEEVNRRLQTASLYQILRNFYESREGEKTVTNAEFRITEQGRLAREILLNKLRETVRGEASPLVYRHENIYEGDENRIEDVTLQEVNERINSAVLLNLVDNLYENTYERLDHSVQNWISAEDTFYGAAENTLYRIEQNTAYLQFLHQEYRDQEENIELYRDETEMIKRLLNLYESSDVRIQQSLLGNTYENASVENREFTAIDESVHTREFTSAETTYLEEKAGDEIVNTEVKSGDQLQEKLYQTYQQNIARNQKYMKNLKTILEQNAPGPVTETPAERMMRDSRLALEHPEEFISRYEDAEKQENQRADVIFREREKLLPPEQQRANELIREYLLAPRNFYHSEMISRDNLGILLADILEAEREENAERRVEEAKKAGSFPETGKDEAVKSGESLLPAGKEPVRHPVLMEGAARFETASSEYREAVLQNLFPVFSTKLIHIRPGITVEEIAGEVNKQVRVVAEEETKEADTALRENLETVITRGTRSEREFTSVTDQTRILEENAFVFRKSREIVNGITDRVIYRWLEKQVLGPVERESFETEQISMVHRSRETSVDEETIENIRQEMQRLEEMNRTTTEKIENRETTEKTVINNTVYSTVEEETKDIQNIVNRSVRQQLDAITERVYGRIEKQLRNEQRRRGL